MVELLRRIVTSMSLEPTIEVTKSIAATHWMYCDAPSSAASICFYCQLSDRISNLTCCQPPECDRRADESISQSGIDVCLVFGTKCSSSISCRRVTGALECPQSSTTAIVQMRKCFILNMFQSQHVSFSACFLINMLHDQYAS